MSLDEAVVDGKGPDLSVIADGPVLGHRGEQFTAAGSADQRRLEHALELEVFAFGEQRVEFPITDVGNEQIDVAAGFLGHHGLGGCGHGGGGGGAGTGRGSRGGGRGSRRI